IRTETVAGFAVTDLDHDVLQSLLADPDAPFDKHDASLLKNGRSSTVADFDWVEADSMRRVILKRFRVASRSDPWKAIVRRSPALRSWVNGQGLRERCLPTPRPLAVFHRRSGALTQEGYLLTERLDDAVGLADFLASLSLLTCAERRALLRRRIEQL